MGCWQEGITERMEIDGEENGDGRDKIGGGGEGGNRH